MPQITEDKNDKIVREKKKKTELVLGAGRQCPQVGY